ncbi:MAG: SDR family NAD(P)-dependent oxidoreductase [Parashewanella sp.]
MQKYCVITGASGGLGSELAVQLSELGYELVLSGRNREKLHVVAKRCVTKTHINVADLIDAAQVDSLARESVQVFGCAPNLVINCAGKGLFGQLDDLDSKAISQTLLVNQLAVIFCCQAFAPCLKKQGGTIVNVMSTAAQKGKANESVYCAAKWGVRGFTESLREEYKATDVRIVAVYPAGMNTEFWKNSDVDYSIDSFMSPKDAATMITTALTQVDKGFVSDIVLSR